MKRNLFSRERFVRWGDCDPAGVIYAPRVFEYAMETLEEFFKEIISISWMDFKDKLKMGPPMVNAEIDYQRPLYPYQKIETEILIKEVSSKTATFIASGFDDQRNRYFRMVMTMCFITEPDFKPANIPDDIRERLLTYQEGSK